MSVFLPCKKPNVQIGCRKCAAAMHQTMIALFVLLWLITDIVRYPFFLYPQSQYGPPEARVYSRTKVAEPRASALV